MSPVLTDKDRAQLDKNIRLMLQSGASREDVIKYTDDYKEFLKKKEPSASVLKDGGTPGTLEVPLVEKPPKGFEGLKPAKVQPTQVFEEKGVGEATMLTRKMERAQKQAISGTGVKLPAAPKAVAAERGMQRAIEPMVEKQVIKDETPKVERFFKGGFGKFLDILDTPGISIIPLGDFIDDIGRSLEAGRKQGSTIMPSIELMKSGAKSSPEDIKNFIEVSKNVGQVPPSDEMLKFRDVYEKEGKGVWGFIKGLAQNPGVAPQIMTSSISALVTNPASMATFGSIVGGGAAIGAATGPGALATAAASLPYAMGAATGVLETGATFAELLQDELNKKKLDFTEDNVRRILEDEKTLSSLRARAATRGAVIGTFDALTGRIAGKVGAKIPTSTPAGRVKSGLASAGIEAVGGATGEAAARKIIGQEMDVAEIGLEGIAQTPTTAVSIASEIYGKPSYKINGELRTKADVEEVLNNAPSEEIKNVKIEVSNDPITEAQVKERVETGDIKRELKEVAPEMSDEKAERIASLERQLKKFEQGTTQISKDKAAAIKEEIKNISKEPDQEIVLKIEEEPEVSATEEKTYRVEYFDPETRKMTHQMFATEAEGEAFKKTLTREQTSQGVTSYFEKAPAKGVGEEGAAPQVPAAQKEIFVTGTAQGLENLKGKAPEGFKDRRMTYEQSGGKQIYFTEDIVGDKKIFSIVDRGATDDYGREGFVSTSMSVPKESTVTLEDVKGELEKLHQQTQTAVDKNTGKIDKAKLGSLELGVGEEVEAAPQVPAAERKNWTEQQYKDEIKRLRQTEGNEQLVEELINELGQKAVADIEAAKGKAVRKVEEKAEVSNLQGAINRYEEGEIETFDDLVNEVETIADSENDQLLKDAVADYREEQRYNESLKGRGDMDAAEGAFLDKIKSAGEVMTEAAPQVPAAPVEKLEKEYRGKTVEELVALKKQLYPSPDIETPMSAEEKILDRVIADKFSEINQSIVAKRKAAEESPRFTSYNDAQKWIEDTSKKYKSKNEFLASQEYKDALPDINALYKVEKADYSKKAKDAMDESGVKIGDRVIYDYVTPFGAETYSGKIVERGGIPFVRFDEGQKTMSGKQSVRWHKGFVKEAAAEVKPELPAAPIEEELPFGETAPREAAKTKEEQNLTKRALNLEVSTPRGEVLQYFISGGKISPEALTEFFGKERRMGMGKIRVEERRSRTSLTNKNAPSIEALAEKIAGTDKLDQVQEYREAIEEALLNHSGTKTMAEELVRDYDADFAEMKRAAELEELGKDIEEETKTFVSQVPATQQEEIMKVLDKFRDNDGFIDWRKIDDEIKFGFEPVLLDLSEPSRKIIDNAIKQFEETGRVGRISPEALPTEAKAGDAARSLAERIRAGKINKEGFRASTGFDVVWDAALEIVASSLEAGASVADAVQDGLRYIRTTDWYKNLTDKKDFEDKFTNRLNEEYNAIQVGGTEEVPVGEAPRGREKVEPGVPSTKPPKAPKKGKTQSEKDLDKLANNVPDTGKVDEYLSKGTIEKYTGETPENSQARGVQELRIALEHGDKIIEKAKEAFGKDYVEKTLEYIEESTAAASNKALMYVSLENALGKEKLANPDRAGEITKLQALVYAKSQEFAREASLALNYQKLRKVAQVGYDTSEITDTFFSSQELKDKRTLNKAIEANPDEVNAMEDEREAERIYSQEELEKKVEQGVRAEVDKLFQQLPKKSKSKAEKALTVLAKWRKQIRGRAYDATLGIPASVIDTGLAVIENAIKIGVSVEKAIDLGIKKIKEGLKGKPWPKENDFRKDMLDFYKQEGIDTKSELPSTNKQYIKEALIKQGFGRKTTIKGEEREVLDWRKLAGEAGTVERIRENVEEAMRNEGFTEQEIKDAQAEYEQEYVDLRQSIIEKAQNELARRNKTTVTSAQKSAAKRLAELYTYGLFEKNYDEYEVAMNKALGVKVSEKTFNEAKKIAEAIKSIYASTFQGVRLSDVSAKSALEKLSDNVRVLVYEQSKKQGSTPFKLASLVRRYLDFTQTMILVSFKNATENFSSGLQQKLIDKLFISMGKQTTPELIKERRRLMKDVYKDMILNGGIGYGKVETRFVNRRHLDDYVNKLSDNQLYHGIASVVTGKATLNAMDAMFKAGLTEARFTSNLIRILTDKSNPNKISKDEALKLVSETLTGQTLEKARVTAKEVIEKINKDAGEVLIKPTEEQINRFANDIVKAALEMNGVITSDQVIAAYNAAYRSAGLSVGHEPNNFFSRMIVGESAKIEGNINNAIKEKNWSNATWLTYYSMFFRNLLNPFAGGGTNWLVIKLEKTGLGLFTGLMYEKSGRKEAMDLSTKEGLARLEKRLFNESRAKDSYLRGLVGGTASLLVFAAFNGAPDDWEEKYKKWRLENKWAAKYLDLITPEMLLAQMAIDAQKTNKRAILQYAATSLNRNDAFSAEEKLFKALDYAAQGDSPRAYGALGEALGARINTPLPWRLVRDGQILYQGVKGEDPYHGNYKPSIGFWSGVLQGGAIEWVGLRPMYEGRIDVSYFKVKDPYTRIEREITEKERLAIRDLTNKEYANLMREYQRDENYIWKDINGKLHISKENQSDAETVTWEEIDYKKLTKEDLRTLDELVKRKALNNAKKEFEFEDGAVVE